MQQRLAQVMQLQRAVARLLGRQLRDVLAEAVQWAARSLPTRPSVPILAGLMLKAGNGQVVLSSFDYETSAQVTVKADVAVSASWSNGSGAAADAAASTARLTIGAVAFTPSADCGA